MILPFKPIPGYLERPLDDQAKTILSLKEVAAVLLKALIPDFDETSLSEILENTLSENKDSPFIELVVQHDTERKENFDLIFSVITPLERSVLIRIDLAINAHSKTYENLPDLNQCNAFYDIEIRIDEKQDKNFRNLIICNEYIARVVDIDLEKGIKPISVIDELSGKLVEYYINLDLGRPSENETTLITQLRNIFTGNTEDFKIFLENHGLNSSERIEEEIKTYSNLQTAVEEEFFLRGERKVTIKTVLALIDFGLSPEEIATALDFSLTEVESIIAQNS